LEQESEQNSKTPMAELEYNTPMVRFWNSFPHDLHTFIIFCSYTINYACQP